MFLWACIVKIWGLIKTLFASKSEPNFAKSKTKEPFDCALYFALKTSDHETQPLRWRWVPFIGSPPKSVASSTY